MARQAEPLEDRFWRFVAKGSHSDCWIWRGGRHPRGYGILPIARGGKNRNVRAHRLSWEMANRCKIPEGMVACHSCDNPPCVNPAHIWIGTQADNMRDMIAKGRKFIPPKQIKPPKPPKPEKPPKLTKPIKQKKPKPDPKPRQPKGFCQKGHEHAVVGLVSNGKSRPICKKCTQERSRRKYERRKARLALSKASTPA